MSRAYRPSNGVWELIDDNEAGSFSLHKSYLRLRALASLLPPIAPLSLAIVPSL